MLETVTDFNENHKIRCSSPLLSPWWADLQVASRMCVIRTLNIFCLLSFPYSGTSSDEMCNLYIMYYMEAKYALSFMTCTKNVAPDMFRTIPAEANIPIPVKPDMVMMHGHHKGELDV